MPSKTYRDPSAPDEPLRIPGAGGLSASQPVTVFTSPEGAQDPLLVTFVRVGVGRDVGEQPFQVHLASGSEPAVLFTLNQTETEVRHDPSGADSWVPVSDGVDINAMNVRLDPAEPGYLLKAYVLRAGGVDGLSCKVRIRNTDALEQTMFFTVSDTEPGSKLDWPPYPPSPVPDV